MEGDDAIGIPPWTENGGLFIACNRERLAEYERLAETGKYYGIESAVLAGRRARGASSAERGRRLWSDPLAGGDGTIDPEGLCTRTPRARARSARASPRAYAVRGRDRAVHDRGRRERATRVAASTRPTASASARAPS